MIETMTLEHAVAKVFDLDKHKMPLFNSSKPIKQVREWLDYNNYPYEAGRGQLAEGVVVFVIGGGSPQYAVYDGSNPQKFVGARVLATISKGKSKSQKRREAILDESDDVPEEEAPTMVDAPEEQSEPQMTVTEPEKPRKRKSSRRKK